VIASWESAQRREVLTWALLRQAAGERAANVMLSETVPACLVAAVVDSATASAATTAAH